MRRVLFHIGLPKTGTSAIQVFLAQNHERLMGRSWDYFRIGHFQSGLQGGIASGNGALVACCLVPEGHPAAFKGGTKPIDDFLAAVADSKADNGLLSSELLCEADEGRLQHLIAALADRGVASEICLFVRSQPQILSSFYIQQVKRHSYAGQPEDLILKHYKVPKFLKYGSYCDRIGSVITPHPVHVRLYEDSVKGEGLLTTFLGVLGLKNEGFDNAVKDINTSLSMKEVKLMTMLNAFRPRMQFSDIIVENSASAGLSRSGGRHSFLKAEHVREIEDYFAEENQKLADTYFNGRTIFPRHDATAVTPFSSVSLSQDDLISFFGGLLVRYDQRLLQLETTVGALERQLRKPG